MNMRTGHRYQGRMHSRCVVIAQTMDKLYKQSVEYYCGSLSSFLMNYTTYIPHQISALRFTCSAAIRHWSNGCHNNGKTEVFHFSRSHSMFNPLLLNLSTLGGLIFRPKNSQRYLGFFFDRKLTLQQHVDFYTNKVLLTIKCMKILGNSSQSLIPTQKRLLYQCCILPIALYSFQLQYFNKAPLLYPLNVL